MHKHPRLRDFGQLGYRCVSQWSSGRRGRLSWERVGGQTDYRVLSRSWGRVWEVQLEFTDGLNTVATQSQITTPSDSWALWADTARKSGALRLPSGVWSPLILILFPPSMQSQLKSNVRVCSPSIHSSSISIHVRSQTYRSSPPHSPSRLHSYDIPSPRPFYLWLLSPGVISSQYQPFASQENHCIPLISRCMV